MARYDKIYEVLAERAVASGMVDIEAFIKRALTGGMSNESIATSLLNDFESGGPLFGRYMRSLTGASGASVRAAVRQGETIGMLAHESRVLKELPPEAAAQLELYSIEDVIKGADPEQLEALEELTDNVSMTWVCALKNTCHKCLPLHGQTRTRREWALKGLDPETIHEDWVSECKCRMVAAAQTTGRQDLTEPLRRVAVGDKGAKRTARAVTQAHFEKAQDAVEEAMKTPQGRALLREMGSVNASK